ncbi:hypothetical protein Pure05_21030 [Paenarthrobacter ureafaciens]|nr:hypothetical protein Pure01_19180 [Paenarthrobacter ureafaciens]GLU63858.1 hypothetical protein Pure02_21080 [Paenarthrobacter ureafaciens]GLU67948.1 hypothetical protein Pure03_19240 [Paenarthrobacter ureafaciens]GLU72394.1 hypothetical protein Pure04_21090 [Paenarthrobacter ureafaciens]GLU76663.1 hypothetical protein Pure05_21030 [Paenarthrobacter ureafaciens]
MGNLGLSAVRADDQAGAGGTEVERVHGMSRFQIRGAEPVVRAVLGVNARRTGPAKGALLEEIVDLVVGFRER